MVYPYSIYAVATLNAYIKPRGIYFGVPASLLTAYTPYYSSSALFASISAFEVAPKVSMSKRDNFWPLIIGLSKGNVQYPLQKSRSGNMATRNSREWIVGFLASYGKLTDG